MNLRWLKDKQKKETVILKSLLQFSRELIFVTQSCHKFSIDLPTQHRLSGLLCPRTVQHQILQKTKNDTSAAVNKATSFIFFK